MTSPTPTPPPGTAGDNPADHLQPMEDHRRALADALFRSRDLSWPELIETARTVQKLNGTLWGQVVAVGGNDGMSPDAELQELRQQVATALMAETSSEMTMTMTSVPGLGAYPQPVQISGPWDDLVSAVMPIVVRLVAQRDGAGLARDRAQLAVKAARMLAETWRLGTRGRKVSDAGLELDKALDKALGRGRDESEGTCAGDVRPQDDDADAGPSAAVETLKLRPLAAIEVREACPFCPGAPMISRRNLRRHIDHTHAAVLEARRQGLLDVYVTASIREAEGQRTREDSQW